MDYISFENLAIKVLNSLEYFKYSEWEDTLLVPQQSISGFFSNKNIFWDKILSMRRNTDASVENFKRKAEYIGSTGWEYEMIMCYYRNKFYFSKIANSRNYTQVSSNHSLSVETDFDSKLQKYISKVILDDRIVDTIKWNDRTELEKFQKSNLVRPIWIMNLHTHPIIQYPGLNTQVYSFFSPADMDSFFRNSMFLTGLVTNKLWVLAKTNLSTQPTSDELKEISRIELYEPQNFESAAGDLMQRHNIVLYSANFKGNLERLN